MNGLNPILKTKFLNLPEDAMQTDLDTWRHHLHLFSDCVCDCLVRKKLEYCRFFNTVSFFQYFLQ